MARTEKHTPIGVSLSKPATLFESRSRGESRRPRHAEPQRSISISALRNDEILRFAAVKNSVLHAVVAPHRGMTTQDDDSAG
jgi:hypothetical protein